MFLFCGPYSFIGNVVGRSVTVKDVRNVIPSVLKNQRVHLKFGRAIVRPKGSIFALDKVVFEVEATTLQCMIAGPYNAVPSSLLGVVFVCGYGLDLVGNHCISVAVRYRIVACSTTFGQGFKKSKSVREWGSFC